MPKRYFDYAATTPLDKRVLSAMLPYFTREFGNPSNLYEVGRAASEAVLKAKEKISKILGCKPDEFVFTGSATESDNMAILGAARANKGKGSRIVISKLEHKGIISACKALQNEGFEIVEIGVQKDGAINLEELKSALTPETILVSITSADSETGTIQPIAEISKIIQNFRKPGNDSASPLIPYLHTDASQTAGYLDINVNGLGVDLMTFSAHKIYGPKGIGGLFVRSGIKLEPIIYGGGQQSLRSGTQNVPGIVGFAEALRLADENKKNESARLKKLRDSLQKGILKSIPKVAVNGNEKNRLPNFLNVSILDIEGEALLLLLDRLGIMVGTGSACNSQSLEPSAVLTALGNPYEYVHGSVRFSLGKGNTGEDVKYVLKHLPKVVKKLRAISPLELEIGQTKAISDPRPFIGRQEPHFLRKKPKWPKN